MNATILTMLANISESLLAVQNLILGMSYIFGIGFVFYALLKYFEATSHGAGAQSRMMPPFYYLVGGVMLIYFPSSITTLASTLFGSTQSILQYNSYDPYSVYHSVVVIINTAGLVWFFRGMVFLMQSGESGGQDNKKSPGKKGIAYLLASVCATNIDSAVSMCNTFLNLLMQWF